MYISQSARLLILSTYLKQVMLILPKMLKRTHINRLVGTGLFMCINIKKIQYQYKVQYFYDVYNTNTIVGMNYIIFPSKINTYTTKIVKNGFLHGKKTKLIFEYLVIKKCYRHPKMQLILIKYQSKLKKKLFGYFLNVF